jgi:hypothetical protein
MKTLRTALAVSALLPLVAAVTPVYAGTQIYDWTLSSGSSAADGGFTYTGGGTLTVNTSDTKTVDGYVGYLVTGITGTLTGGGSFGLSTTTSFGSVPFVSDDYFFPTGTSLVEASTNANSYTGGIGFSTPSGNFLLISSYAMGTPISGNAYDEISTSGASVGVGQFTASAVPLPASVWTMIFGLGALGFVGLRAKKLQP